MGHRFSRSVRSPPSSSTARAQVVVSYTGRRAATRDPLSREKSCRSSSQSTATFESLGEAAGCSAASCGASRASNDIPIGLKHATTGRQEKKKGDLMSDANKRIDFIMMENRE